MEKTTLEEAQEALKEILKNTERIGTYAKNEQKKSDGETAMIVLGNLDRGELREQIIGFVGTSENIVLAIVRAMLENKDVRFAITAAAESYKANKESLPKKN